MVAGCDDALEKLMQRHTKRLVSRLTRLLKSRAEAQETVQEAFVRVYRHREHFAPQARFAAWLHTIAFNLARDRLRQRARRPHFVSPEELPDQELENLKETFFSPERAPDFAMEQDEGSRSLARAVASLPDSLREPLVLFAEEGKSQAEIAAAMHCSVKAIEMRLYHARKHLRSSAKIVQRT